MAKNKKSEDLFDRLRASGVRKNVARTVSGALGGGKSRARKSPKAVQDAIGRLRAAADEIEDRATGRTTKRKAAAKKAAATRRRTAAKRSAAAKKGARTRAKAGR